MSKYNEVKVAVEQIETKISSFRNQGMNNKTIEEHFWNHEKKTMEQYPFLVNAMIESDDRTMLNYMLENLRMVENGIISQKDADMDVTTKLINDSKNK